MSVIHYLTDGIKFWFSAKYNCFFVILALSKKCMELNKLTALSPVDGRYRDKAKTLAPYFSEFGLIRYRILVEIEYFIALTNHLPELSGFPPEKISDLRKIYENYDEKDTRTVKKFEKTTNHDVKAVEYFLKEKFDTLKLSDYKEFIHFGITSQDINNTALPLSVKEALENELQPLIDSILKDIERFGDLWKEVPMLSRTHGQPASPTTVGKEILVFHERLRKQVSSLSNIPYASKFGGAVGNFNAHFAAYPDIDWHSFADNLVSGLGLVRSHPTTQIEHYDQLAALFDALKRINTILIDLCRDLWSYISLNYFHQKIVEGETGSSTMPHKVNPIDFENAEGNLGIANALLVHMSGKLPISRMQRDLTDSTVTRNVGPAFGHMVIALNSISRGLGKIELNREMLNKDLEDNWMVLAEAIQTILRRIGYPEPYETLKSLTRKNERIGKKEIHKFIDELDIGDAVKEEMKQLTPQNYIGKF